MFNLTIMKHSSCTSGFVVKAVITLTNTTVIIQSPVSNVKIYVKIIHVFPHIQKSFVGLLSGKHESGKNRNIAWPFCPIKISLHSSVWVFSDLLGFFSNYILFLHRLVLIFESGQGATRNQNINRL